MYYPGLGSGRDSATQVGGSTYTAQESLGLDSGPQKYSTAPLFGLASWLLSMPSLSCAFIRLCPGVAQWTLEAQPESPCRKSRKDNAVRLPEHLGKVAAHRQQIR